MVINQFLEETKALKGDTRIFICMMDRKYFDGKFFHEILPHCSNCRPYVDITGIVLEELPPKPYQPDCELYLIRGKAFDTNGNNKLYYDNEDCLAGQSPFTSYMIGDYYQYKAIILFA